MEAHGIQRGPLQSAPPSSIPPLKDGSPACTAIAIMVGEAIDALVRETARNGVIPVEQVHRIIRRIMDQQSAMVHAFGAQEQRCRVAFRPNPEAIKRSDPFRRLVTRPIEHLLAGENAAFPRRFLPNYFEIVDQALEGKRDHIRQQAGAIYHSLRLKHGAGAVWNTFFADPRTERLLAHVLRRMVRFADSPVGQWTWPLIMSRASPDGRVPTPEQMDRLREAIRLAWQGLRTEEAVRGATGT